MAYHGGPTRRLIDVRAVRRGCRGAILVCLLFVENGDETSISLGLVPVPPLLRRLVLVLVVFVLGSEQDVVSPAPPHELTELLEDQEVQDTTRGDLIVIVAGYPVPV